MKKLFIFALLANIGLFGWYTLGRKPASSRIDRAEMQADQIKVITEQEIPASSPTPIAAEPVASAPVAEPVEVVASKTETKPAALACFSLGPVADNDWVAAKTKLREFKIAIAKSVATEIANKYWVYIPPLGSLDLAQRKAAQLTALGVTEYFVIQDGSKWQTAISLGIFSTKEAADKQLLNLQAQGVRSAVVKPREPITRTWNVVFRKLNEEKSDQLKLLAKTLTGAALVKEECGKG